MKRRIGIGAAAAAIAAAAFAIAQPDLEAFRDAQRRARTGPAAVVQYQHNPVVARFDGVAVNLHAVVAYRPGDNETTTVLEPGGIVVPIAFEDFDAVMRRYTRSGDWRPGVSP